MIRIMCELLYNSPPTLLDLFANFRVVPSTSFIYYIYEYSGTKTASIVYILGYNSTSTSISCGLALVVLVFLERIFSPRVRIFPVGYTYC